MSNLICGKCNEIICDYIPAYDHAVRHITKSHKCTQSLTQDNMCPVCNNQLYGSGHSCDNTDRAT